jgi:predicted Co/Zn/Cd cation transporter (cation efflux family)
MNVETASSLPSPLPPSARGGHRWLTLLLAFCIFVAGMASGAALTVHLAMNRLQFAIHHPEVAPARIAATIRRRLGLNEEQAAQVERIIDTHQVKISAIRRNFQPAIVEELSSLRDEIAEVLTDPQRERWTKLFNQFEERWLPPAAKD